MSDNVLHSVLPRVYRAGNTLRRNLRSITDDPRNVLRIFDDAAADLNRQLDMPATRYVMQGGAMADHPSVQNALRREQDAWIDQLSGGGVGRVASSGKKITQATRDARMAEQGYERGYWRGGKSVADGDYYTPDRSAAEAFGARHGDKADVREYALRKGREFDFHAGSFGADDMAAFADQLVKSGDMAPHIAREFAQMAGDFGGRMPARALYQVLSVHTPNPTSALRKLGFDSLNAGQEVVMLQPGRVRDPVRAAFDPKKIGVANPFATFAGASALGGAALLGDEETRIR